MSKVSDERVQKTLKYLEFLKESIWETNVSKLQVVIEESGYGGAPAINVQLVRKGIIKRVDGLYEWHGDNPSPFMAMTLCDDSNEMNVSRRRERETVKIPEGERDIDISEVIENTDQNTLSEISERMEEEKISQSWSSLSKKLTAEAQNQARLDEEITKPLQRPLFGFVVWGYYIGLTARKL